MWRARWSARVRATIPALVPDEVPLPRCPLKLGRRKAGGVVFGEIIPKPTIPDGADASMELASSRSIEFLLTREGVAASIEDSPRDELNGRDPNVVASSEHRCILITPCRGEVSSSCKKPVFKRPPRESIPCTEPRLDMLPIEFRRSSPSARAGIAAMGFTKLPPSERKLPS
jgi:hypothetical protein